MCVPQCELNQHWLVKLAEAASIQLVHVSQDTLRNVLEHLELLLGLGHLQLLDELLVLDLFPLFLVHEAL